MRTKTAWEGWVPTGKQAYEKRVETVERIFADAKEKYAMHAISRPCPSK